MPPMRWQDLIYLKCPNCSAHLEEWQSRSKMYRCKTEGCNFLISARRLADILFDEQHMLRKHLSDQQRKDLAQPLNSLSQ